MVSAAILVDKAGCAASMPESYPGRTGSLARQDLPLDVLQEIERLRGDLAACQQKEKSATQLQEETAFVDWEDASGGGSANGGALKAHAGSARSLHAVSASLR